MEAFVPVIVYNKFQFVLFLLIVRYATENIRCFPDTLFRPGEDTPSRSFLRVNWFIQGLHLRDLWVSVKTEDPLTPLSLQQPPIQNTFTGNATSHINKIKQLAHSKMLLLPFYKSPFLSAFVQSASCQRAETRRGQVYPSSIQWIYTVSGKKRPPPLNMSK